MLGVLSLLTCSRPPYYSANDYEEVKYARDKAEAYFGVSIEDNVTMASIEDVQRSCGLNAAACNKFGVIIIHEDVPQYICQQALHEFGHSGAHKVANDWDYNHTLYPDYYTTYMSESCKHYSLDNDYGFMLDSYKLLNTLEVN